MKRLLTAVAALTFLTAVPVFALDAPDRDTRSERRERTTVIDDVIRMSQAGVSDDAIIKFVRESRDGFVVDADVIIALTNAHVSKPVLEAVMDESYRDDRDNGDRRTTTRSTRTTVVVSPYVGYDPWFYGYGYGYYDPFWYGPRLSVNFRFGGGHYYGGGYRGGHYGGGHGGGRGHH